MCSAEAIDFVYLSLVHRKEEQNRVVYSNHSIGILNVVAYVIYRKVQTGDMMGT